MSLNVAALERLRTGGEKGERPGPTYRHGKVLAFDQSLANTGWAIVQYTGTLSVVETGTISEQGIGNRFVDSLPHTVVLYQQFRTVLRNTRDCEVVHEAPGIGMRNSDSSVMAATALRIAVEEEGRQVSWMPNRVSYYKTVTGNGKATKGDMKNVLADLFGHIKPGPMNEHTRDAIGLGVAYLRSDR